jgi:glycosyltransferase involved in cell wall biosynthesis
MKIAIVTDAWHPQVNGVVTTLTRTSAELTTLGHEVRVISPVGFRTVPLPSYPEIRIAVWPGRRVAAELAAFAPDAVHVATEATLGRAARTYCRKVGQPFTTSYHTQFPEYLRSRLPVPLGASYAVLRSFHAAAARTMVATQFMRARLEDRGLTNLVMWERGVDTELFRPAEHKQPVAKRPVWVYVGRVAVEKNIDAFLRLDLPGTKQIIGAGPQLEEFRRRYPEVEFLGYRFGAELAAAIAQGDCFVFPSLTDTFGLVMLEAMACGLPVAAYPVTGPVDVVEQGVTGVLHDDLGVAALAALKLDPQRCRAHALTRTWRRATDQFVNNLAVA